MHGERSVGQQVAQSLGCKFPFPAAHQSSQFRKNWMKTENLDHSKSPRVYKIARNEPPFGSHMLDFGQSNQVITSAMQGMHL